jgi:UDP-N-acetyl-D-glucosamine dehydrogenase
VVFRSRFLKIDISDIRESPILPNFDEPEKVNAEVTVCDPFADQIPFTNETQTTIQNSYYKSQFLVISGTAHTCFDYEKILIESTIVLDNRSACKETGYEYPNFNRLWKRLGES